MATSKGEIVAKETTLEEDQVEEIPDYQPPVWHFKFQPDSVHSQGGIHFTSLMGECEADRIYPVYQEAVAQALRDSDEWESVSQRQYDAQAKADVKEKSDGEE